MIMVLKSLFTRAAEFYFAPKSFERDGKIYEMLGIKFWKKYIPNDGSHIRRLYKQLKLIKNKEDAINYEATTRKLEGIHIRFFFLCVLFGLILGVLLRSGFPFLIFGMGNIFVNVYPIMLQRYNRERIYRTYIRRA